MNMEEAVKGKAKRRHLNADECDDLGQTAGGTNALTQPHFMNHCQGNRDPNKWLYPRTLTKRRRQAMTSGPQPKDEDYEEEEIDDISLLAAAFSTESQATEEEQEEVDDFTQSSDMVTSEEEEVVDYLEGITAEMFGVDDEFERAFSDIHNEEEEVEALPDAHYGLLGSSRVLLQPQGCMHDLPEEVLRQVLCHVPAKDLFRSVGLVCHRLRDIVHDAKFLPFRKQYYRYMMGEKETEREIFSILKNSRIQHPASSQHSIRNLVVPRPPSDYVFLTFRST